MTRFRVSRVVSGLSLDPTVHRERPITDLSTRDLVLFCLTCDQIELDLLQYFPCAQYHWYVPKLGYCGRRPTGGQRMLKAASEARVRQSCSCDEHGDQSCMSPCMLPAGEIFFLRTGQRLWELATTRSEIVADVDEPHRVVSNINIEPISWKTYPNANAASPTRASAEQHTLLLDLMHCRQDRQAMRLALDLLRHCPDGLVSMSVRSEPDTSLSSAQVFLVLRNSRTAVCVQAHKICECGVSRLRRLEPVLHVEWWAEMDENFPHGEAESRRFVAFDDKYEEDSGDEIYQETNRDVEFAQRDPLEVAATQRYLVQDLLRRTMNASCGRSTIPTSTSLNTKSNRSQEMLPSHAQANMSERSKSAASLNSPAVCNRPEDLSLRAVAKRISNKVSIRFNHISRKHTAACGIFRKQAIVVEHGYEGAQCT